MNIGFDISNPRIGVDKVVDVYAGPVQDRLGCVVVMLHERSIADKMDRQLTHRDSARSVTGLASMLGHEVKNPLSGIRGAAQLLEGSVSDDDRALTQLITEETDRIVRLIRSDGSVLRSTPCRAGCREYSCGA